ncbi:hypothetical protein QN374_16965, partial [Herbaspirillum sp. RTI4]
MPENLNKYMDEKMSDAKLEKIKYNYSSKLEEKKIHARQEEIGYLEAGLHLRSLNGFLWRVPGMTIAITGGLWYGVT